MSAATLDRRMLMRGAAVGAVAASTMTILPTAAVADPGARWAMLVRRYDAAHAAADEYHAGPYGHEVERAEAYIDQQPPLWFEHTATNGQTARFAVKVDVINPFRCEALDRAHAEAAAAWLAWDRRCQDHCSDPQYCAVTSEMDRLWDREDEARRALMEEPAPHAAALAMKVRLALDEERMSEDDRRALLAEASRQLGDQ